MTKPTCPNGHKLPHRTSLGQCLPQACADERRPPRRKPETRRGKEDRVFGTKETVGQGTKELNAALAPISSEEYPALETKEAALDSMRSEAKSLGRGIGSHLARKAFLQVPGGLDGQAAEDWVEKKKTALAVEAMAELEYQLKLGNDDRRITAAIKILESAGHGKKEPGGNGFGAPVIILQGADVISPPWLPRIVEGKKDGGSGEKK